MRARAIRRCRALADPFAWVLAASRRVNCGDVALHCTPLLYRLLNLEGCHMTRYKVMVDDNFHYMDEEERFELGMLLTAEEAVAACKRIVDEDLDHLNQPGMTAAKLNELYTMFGSDPFIVAVRPNDEIVEFSAWKYAKERSSLVASRDGSERGDP
jgi:hypothetical protein